MVCFVGLDTYLEASGSIARDLFESDGGGWLTDPALLDRLVDAKLKAEGARILAEGWKWVTTAIDLPWDATRGFREIDREEVAMTEAEASRVAELEAEGEELGDEWADAHDVPDEVHARIEAIDAELGALVDRPLIFAPEDMAMAGAFVSLDRDGSVRVERGFVKPEDQLQEGLGDDRASGPGDTTRSAGSDGEPVKAQDDAEGAEDAGGLRPLGFLHQQLCHQHATVFVAAAAQRLGDPKRSDIIAALEKGLRLADVLSLGRLGQASQKSQKGKWAGQSHFVLHLYRGRREPERCRPCRSFELVAMPALDQIRHFRR
jgi:hypothetical protein